MVGYNPNGQTFYTHELLCLGAEVIPLNLHTVSEVTLVHRSTAWAGEVLVTPHTGQSVRYPCADAVLSHSMV